MTQTERNPRGDAAASAEPEIVRSGVPIVAIGASMVLAGIAAALSDGVIQPWLTAVAGAAIGAASTLMFGPTATARGAAESDGLRAASTSSLAHDEVLRSKAIEIRSGERTKLLDALGDAVVLVDLHGETRFANASARAMLGERAAIAGTRHAIESLPPMVMRAVTGVVAAGGTERRRIECALRDPGLTPVVIHIANIGGSEERLASIVVRDVRVERETDRIKDEFVAKANHELRTPLTIIRGYLHRLVNQAPDRSELQIQLSLVAEEVERLISISNKLLVLSQADAGRVSLEIQPIKLNDMVGEMVDDLKAQHQDLTFSMDMPSGITFQGDNELIWQLTSNLFGNAVKYNRPQGQVQFKARISDNKLVFSLSNTTHLSTSGLDDRIFERFYRFRETDKKEFTQVSGSGLGLSLCREIVTAHGGTLKMHVEDDSWVIFECTLPCGD